MSRRASLRLRSRNTHLNLVEHDPRIESPKLAGIPNGESGEALFVKNRPFRLVRDSVRSLGIRVVPSDLVAIAPPTQPTPTNLVRRCCLNTDFVRVPRLRWKVNAVQLSTIHASQHCGGYSHILATVKILNQEGKCWSSRQTNMGRLGIKTCICVHYAYFGSKYIVVRRQES
jgi:hypothetical protein